MDAPIITPSGSDPGSTGMMRLEKDIRDIKEALLSADASSVLPPVLLMNNKLRKRYADFKTFGLNSEIIKELMVDDNHFPRQQGKDPSSGLQDSLLKVLSKISITGFKKDGDGRRIFSFLGPTGVGKTTTLAKIAAMTAVKQGKKATLITLDTFRIAAVAQLQVYARIMGFSNRGRHKLRRSPKIDR